MVAAVIAVDVEVFQQKFTIGCKAVLRDFDSDVKVGEVVATSTSVLSSMANLCKLNNILFKGFQRSK